MTRPVGRMVAEVVGDVGKLADQLQRDANRALRRVDLDLDPQLQEIARDADRVFTGVAADADGAAEEIGRDFEAAGERAEGAFDELRRSANADLNAIQRNATISTGAASGRFKAFAAVGVAAFATVGAAAAAGLGAITVFGLRSAAQLEQTAIGFEALLGSAKEAATFLREVQEFAAETPFEFQGIADASRRILAFGAAVGIARDEVLPTIETIGSLVSVLGGGQFEIEAVVRAMGQMASKGKISQEELLQLAEALPGFSANAAIAAGLGVSTAEAMEMITKGEVSAREGIDLLLEGMAKFPGAAGAMAAQAQTLTGVFSTFKDTVSIALTDAFTPVIPAIKDALTLLTPIIGDAIGVLAPAIGVVIEQALPLVGVLTEAFTPVLVPVLEALAALLPIVGKALVPLGAVMAELVDSLDPLVQAMGDFIAVLVTDALVPVLEELVPQLAEMAPVLADVLIALVPLIPPLGELLVSFLKMQTPLIELLALFLQFITIKGLVPAVAEFTKNLTLLLDVFGPMIEEFSDLSNWPDMLGRAGESLSKLGSIIGSWASDAVAAVGDFFANIGSWFADLPARLVGWLDAAFHAGLRAIGRGIGLFVAAWIALPGLISAAIKGLPVLLWGLFTKVMNQSIAIIRLGLGLLIDNFRTLPGRAWDAVRRLPGVLWDAVTGAFRRAREGASGGLSRLVSLIGEAPGRLRNLGGRMLSAGAHLIRQFLAGLGRIGGFVGNIAGAIANALRSRLNDVIRSVNSGIADIDDALPFGLPRIPLLARGGLTQQGGPAVLHPSELVLPLESRRAVDLLSQAMAEASAGLRAVGVPEVDTTGEPAFDVHVYIGDRELTDIVDVRITRRDRDLRRRVVAGAGRRVNR